MVNLPQIVDVEGYTLAAILFMGNVVGICIGGFLSFLLIKRAFRWVSCSIDGRCETNYGDPDEQSDTMRRYENIRQDFPSYDPKRAYKMASSHARFESWSSSNRDHKHNYRYSQD